MSFTGISWKMDFHNWGSVVTDHPFKMLCLCSSLFVSVFVFGALISGTPYFANDYNQRILGYGTAGLIAKNEPALCKSHCKPLGSEPLPQGIIRRTSNLEMHQLWDFINPQKMKAERKPSKSLLCIAVGIKQKHIVDQIIQIFPSDNFTVMLFHYDGLVDGWEDLSWNDNAIHVSAVNQTKWWFAKRFLHPEIVAEYDYIFLWDEDLGVEHFDPRRHAVGHMETNIYEVSYDRLVLCHITYLSIVKREGLEISQPALDPSKSEVHHRITARWRKGDVHRRMYKYSGGGRCYENSTAPPCTGWVEMMAPVFSKAAWRCAWYMIQNDLIHAWGLDMKLGYCAQGVRSKNVGVVDSEYIVHKGIPTLGGHIEDKVHPRSPTPPDRSQVRFRSFTEFEIFKRRWKKAIANDKCWTDPYPDPSNSTGR